MSAGCGLLPLHAEIAAKAKIVHRAAKPLDAKAFYLRMAEIDHGSDIELAAEMRHFRRAIAGIPPSRYGRVLTASLHRFDEVDTEATSALKALGKPPPEVRAFHALTMQMLDDSHEDLRRMDAFANRGDIKGFDAEVARQTSARKVRRAHLDAMEKGLRHRFALGAKPKSLSTQIRSDPPPRHAGKARPIRSINDPRIDPKDRAFVLYAARLQKLMVKSKSEMAAFTTEMREGMPHDAAGQDAYMRRCTMEALRMDRATRATLRRMGPAPRGLQTYVRLLDRQVTTSIEGSERILAGSYSAREMVGMLNDGKAGANAIEAEIRAESAHFLEQLREIKAKYEG